MKFRRTTLARDKSLVGISFDDGPSLHTPRVLEILKSFGSSATFFWIVENAVKLKREEPETFEQIIIMVKETDSEIGLHAPYDYKPNLMSRILGKFTKQEIREAKVKLEELIGLQISLYRPHYLQLGRSTLFAHELGLTTVWGDLIHYAEPDTLREYQIRKFSNAKPGNILIFHDGNTILRKTTNVTEVLPSVLKNLNEKGLHGITVSRVIDLK